MSWAGGAEVGSRTRTLSTAAAAAALAAATVLMTGLVRGTYPFGSTSRSTNDLGEQFIPMYAYARDVLTGQADGDLLWSWQSGHGVPFIGDSLAYVGSTLSWVTLLFPRDRIDLALYAVFVLAVALGAFLMTLLLQRLRPEGPAWLALVGGVAYGTCAWSVETAYMTVWLNGMVAFPLLCLLADWVVSTPRWQPWAATPPLVALAWTSHFYTAYMATLGAAVFVVARLLTQTEVPVAERVRGLVRCGVAFALGIALTAPVLVPVYRLIDGATPSPPNSLSAVPWDLFLARLLPATAGVQDTPAIGVGLLVLVLAATAALNPRLGIAERTVWPVVLLLVVVSMRLQPTHLVWHAFDTPNGNPYRQSFVTCGFLVITGWLSGSRGVPRRVVLVGMAAATGLWWWTLGARDHTSLTTPTFLLTLVAVIVGGYLLTSSTRRQFALAGAGVLVLASAAEAVASHAAIDERRSTVITPRGVWSEEHDAARADLLRLDDWPRSRTDPGWLFTNNDPMLLGGQGSEYYTSTIQLDVSELHAGLGWGFSSYGRALVDPMLEVTDAIFATRHRLVNTETGHEVVTRELVAPVVAVRAPSDDVSTLPGVWGAHERALGGSLYDLPPVTVTAGPDTTISQRSGKYRVSTTARGTFRMEVRCAPGREALLFAPEFVGRYRVDGREGFGLKADARRPGLYTGKTMSSLGTVGPGGSLAMDVTTLTSATALPANPIGCLDRSRLREAVDALSRGAATEVATGSRSIDFTVPAGTGSTRLAVVSTTLTPGWRCTGPVDGGQVESFDGFMGVPLSDAPGRVSCRYRPAGMVLGAAVGGVAALVWLGLLGLGLFQRRRPQTPRHTRPSEPTRAVRLAR